MTSEQERRDVWVQGELLGDVGYHRPSHDDVSLGAGSGCGADAIDRAGASSVEDLLSVLARVDAERLASEQRLRECVHLLRARRASWREIGETLGVSRQAAWERFHGDGSRP